MNKEAKQAKIAAIVARLDKAIYSHRNDAEDSPKNAGELVASTTCIGLLEERISDYICDLAQGKGIDVPNAITFSDLVSYIKSKDYQPAY